jgi:branched-chain amino acid transport system ATP-binding protein
MSLLETKDLCSGYGKIQILHGINIVVNKGEFVSIIGANGAGKTTFLRTISGNVTYMSGSIAFDGKNLTGTPAHLIPALGIAHVPEGRQIFPQLTVKDNLLVGAYLNRNPQLREKQLHMVLDLFPRLKERLSQLAGTMSGGEQQMLAVSRALMFAPKLLMLDEPSQGLAPKIVGEMYEKLREIHANGTTILLVEQNVTAALKYSGRSYVFEHGKVSIEGTSEELKSNEEIRRAYLGV